MDLVGDEKMELKPTIETFELDPKFHKDCSVIIPTVVENKWLTYGEHCYYFLNFKTLKGLKITLSHIDIIKPGIKQFIHANNQACKRFPKIRSLFKKYHYGFNLLEQIMLMTVPHTVTEVSDGRFFITLWSYVGYLDIDCKSKKVFYRQSEVNDSDHVFGSQQIWDNKNKQRYYMSYSLTDSMKKVQNVNHPVFCKIIKENKQQEKSVIWEGAFTDYIHDMIIDKNKQYCIVSELGMFVDSKGEMVPSEVLVIDMKNQKEWRVGDFIVAAHAQFDPTEADVLYVSNHNFRFEHRNILKALKSAMYKMTFNGPASVFKYRITNNGLQKIATFTEPDFFRLTNFHVFIHRGQKLLVAMGFPHYLYFADADTMTKIKRIEVVNPDPKISCLIGTFSPSLDGEHLFIHTNVALLELNIATEHIDIILNHNKIHSCSNHMITSTDINW